MKVIMFVMYVIVLVLSVVALVRGDKEFTIIFLLYAVLFRTFQIAHTIK